MDLNKALKQRIINLAKENHITLHKLSVLSGIPYSTLSNFLVGRCQYLSVSNIFHLCEGLNITLKEFFHAPDLNAAILEENEHKDSSKTKNLSKNNSSSTSKKD